jgi:hypothetical protein
LEDDIEQTQERPGEEFLSKYGWQVSTKMPPLNKTIGLTFASLKTNQEKKKLRWSEQTITRRTFSEEHIHPWNDKITKL